MRMGSRFPLTCARQALSRPSRASPPGVVCHRHRSTALPEPATAELSPRWLSDVKKRLGYCLAWGLQPAQTREAGQLLQEIASDWRELVAGSEGFLTSKQRRSTFRQQVVWGEQDSMGHVNNVVYNRYAETGRVDYFRKFAMYIDPAHAKEWNSILTPQGDGLLLRKITTEFKFPMRYPDHVTIYHKLGTEPVEGTDTFIMDAIILSEVHQRPAARCIEDCVLYDYTTAKKRPLLPYMLPVLQHTWKLQEEAKRVNSQRVFGLLERVRKLEKESWDRAGAVEDMGTAGS